jgi:hypothetical protein
MKEIMKEKFDIIYLSRTRALATEFLNKFLNIEF